MGSLAQPPHPSSHELGYNLTLVAIGAAINAGIIYALARWVIGRLVK